MQKVKKFKYKNTYYINLLLRIGIIAAFSWLFYSIMQASEDEIVELFGNRELIGRSKQRGSIAIGKLLVNKWGKAGIYIPSLLMLFGAIYYFIKEFLEFIRFIKKDKLYKQGLVNNLNDDHAPKSLIQFTKEIFRPKANKYPTEKEMRESLKNNKYFK